METSYGKAEGASQALDERWKNLGRNQMAEEAVRVATLQLLASSEFKKPRLQKLNRYWELYDGKVPKKLRQLFNIPIPVFAGMVDTLNAQYDTPVRIKFKEGDPADFFKVQKIQGAFNMEVMSTAENSKWDSKLRMARKHAIINGVAIPKLTATSDPEYKSDLELTNLKNFHFQPRGGLYLENHLFAGEEDIEKTRSALVKCGEQGIYDKAQVALLLSRSSDREYLPMGNDAFGEKLNRFKPLGLDPDNHSYVGETVFKLAQWILNIGGKRYLLVFHPWTQTWLRFEPWKDICSNELLPWVPMHTHEDDENFLSKSFADDLFPASDAIVAMFNQELTNREKRNFGARAYDKDMFKDVRKLDEAMHRPDALVPADTAGGAKRISEGVFEFKVGDLGGTVDLIDWITGSLGQSTGANDLAQGSVQEVSKKASVTFAEQRSISKRISWGAAPFQEMMAGLGKRYVAGLKDHMPSKMAIRLMGEYGWDWDQITRLDLDTTKDVDVLIESTDKQREQSELMAEKQKDVLLGLGADPILAPAINPKWRASKLLAVGGWEEADIAEALDVKSNTDRKSSAKAAEAIQLILQNQKPELWFGATTAFMQKIVDFANDKRTTLKGKHELLINYAMAHTEIVAQNLERKAMEEARAANAAMMMQPQAAPAAPQPKPAPSGVPGGVAHAMDIAASV